MTRRVLGAPHVRIELYGSDQARALQRAFTARHPRFRLVASKRWGVALIDLPASFDAYLAGKPKQAVRTNRRRAESAGFRYAQVSPQDYLGDIIEVNRSAPVRQGREMDVAYVDDVAVAKTFERHKLIHAVLDTRGHLRAYAVTLDLGDLCMITMILGHAEDLEHGLMYLLASEIVRSTIQARRPDGSPHWLMYDTFWGAAPGLAYFKERAGFLPYVVDWILIDRAIDVAGNAPPSSA